MKAILIYLAGIILILSGCKKDNVESTPLASLKLVNTVSNGAPVQLRSDFMYRHTASDVVNNNTDAFYSLKTGNPDIYVYPVADSLNPYYSSNKSVSVANGDVFTLFLGGSSTAVESILVNENLPVHTDSTCGIRFVNLSPGSPAVKVTLSTSTGVSEFGDIQYKQITDFKSFPATTSHLTYTLQVRNAATNALIASITMSGTARTTFVPRFKNVTLVLRGIVGGSPAAGITRVNHYL